jgi:hypothetical protein
MMEKRRAAFIEPMLLLRTDKLPKGPEWLSDTCGTVNSLPSGMTRRRRTDCCPADDPFGFLEELLNLDVIDEEPAQGKHDAVVILDEQQNLLSIQQLAARHTMLLPGKILQCRRSLG